jgi:hypothetical protein
MRLPTRLMPAALVFLLLAGCVGDSGGSAKLSYDGSGTGNHSDSTDCDKEGHLLGSGNIEDGSIHVSVTTDDGEHYVRDFTGEFTLASQELTGQSGDWTLSVTRVGDSNLGLSDFRGSYSFTLTC